MTYACSICHRQQPQSVNTWITTCRTFTIPTDIGELNVTLQPSYPLCDFCHQHATIGDHYTLKNSYYWKIRQRAERKLVRKLDPLTLGILPKYAHEFITAFLSNASHSS